MPESPWSFWIDVGGTFTDCVARRPDGALLVHKVLNSVKQAPIAAIRCLMGLKADEEIGEVEVCLGTTLGTNALLERRGAPTALVTTKGFGDILRIAYQDRPRLFDLSINKPAALYLESVELDERVSAAGEILTPLDQASARRKLSALKEHGIGSIAVCLMNSYRNGEHERIVERLAEELGFKQVSVSSKLVPLQKIVSRGDTTVVDAYLSPIIRAYVKELRKNLPKASLRLMTSAGGLASPEAFVGKDSILSGPAGGVVGHSRVAERSGFKKVIGFDMGGTSTDVSRYDEEFEYRYEMEINDPESGTGVRVVSPMLRIETVAAGGGSICRFDGQIPRVGPGSAGAVPGPACYGAGGPLTVTDVNVLLGRVPREHFPFPLDIEAARARLEEIRAAMKAAGQDYQPEELAEGFVRIANRTMAQAIRKVSLARGYDVREYALVSFGGAGSQHACAVARELGIKTVLCHPYAGVLSAYGMAAADIQRFKSHAVGRPCGKETLALLDEVFAGMEAELEDEILAEGISKDRILPPVRMLELRYAGQDWTLTVPEPEDGDYAARFEALHRERYGFTYPGRAVEIVDARMKMTGRMLKAEPPRTASAVRDPEPFQRTRCRFAGEWLEAGLFRRADLAPGDRIAGPAIVLEDTSTVVLEPGWKAEVDAFDALVLTDGRGRAEREAVGAGADLITLGLFNSMFASVAEEAGVTLRNTASSTNVKERLDFSCAVFDQNGGLVANAPHIPVHLGAMDQCVRRVMAAFPDMRPGDAFITNDPFRGGSHLPDVTVVTPVFEASEGKPLFFTASRAHHAEIGGIAPGSLPPSAKNLAEEGVLIRAFRLVSGDRTSEDALRELLEGSAYPSRSVDDNLADIRAQVAANKRAAGQLLEMVRRYGGDVVLAYMGHIQDAASSMMQRALRGFPPGERVFEDRLDDGSRIRVKITISHEGAEGASAGVDFAGTDPVVKGNLNANTAIVRSAVLYSLRCLIEEDIPLNSGVLAPVKITVPQGCLLNPLAHDDPARCPAVGGGNVETSQRVVDVVLGALGVAAASQGTMNNLLFGRAKTADAPGFGYYETIGGGAGACPGFDGADAVHSHMTNTRLTDPEVLEDRFPIRLRNFEIRRGSGGKGRSRGGDGIIREIEFLSGLRVSLLTGRRETAPYGLDGGKTGEPGRNLLKPRGAADFEKLGWSAEFDVRAGDILRIETPGGGGAGAYSK